MWGEVLVTMRLDSGTECRFEGEEVRKIMKLPEGQEVVIEGGYSHESGSRAFLSDCSLIYPQDNRRLSQSADAMLKL